MHSLRPPGGTRYRLRNARIPPALCNSSRGGRGWQDADILIENGRIASISAAGSDGPEDVETVDLNQSIVCSALVDPHVHLDKAYVAAFQPFEPGDLASAMAAMAENKRTWTPETLEARIEFSLNSAFAYGVRAMRTHLDMSRATPHFTRRVLFEAKARWAGRVDLQIAPLAGLKEYEDPEMTKSVLSVAREGGIMGFFVYDHPDITARLRPLFEQAHAEGWDIDLHVDEGTDPALDGLNAVGATALATGYGGQILCGHCVALASYDEPRRRHVVEQALEAGVHFVSLPATNLYLQGRSADGIPVVRGMAPVRYLAERGAVVSLGADNVQDGFCTFGEFDPAAVLNLGAQVGHLAEAARDWMQLITTNPARTMGLDWEGFLEPGAPADLVVFSARSSGEFGSGVGIRRIVIRRGQWIDAVAPDFRDLNPRDRSAR